MPDVPYGFCHCGCGEKTNPAKQSITALGQVKGEPMRFLRNHHTKTPEARAAFAARMTARAGIPADAPKDADGHSCKRRECAWCGKEFLVRWSESDRVRCCSMRCSGLRRRKDKRLKDRKGAKNPNFKGGSRTGVRDREGERRWYAAQIQFCQHPGCPGGTELLACHHVVYEQHVRAKGGDRWDPDNSLTLCFVCHSSHHRKGRYTVPLIALRDENYAFAFDLMGPAAYDYLRRYYVGEDPRLDALLSGVAA